MKKILILTSFIITTILLISGCRAAGPEVQTSEELPLITQYTGIINEVDSNEMFVYTFAGYNGEVLAKISEETKIDDSLKSMIKPDNLITFTTNGIMTRSIPPQVIVVSIDSIIENVVFEGTVSEVSEDAITVDMTYPHTDKIIARFTPDTVFAEGVSEDIKAGNTVRFETTGLMQLSEPAQINVVRFTKNGSSEIQSDFIQKKIDEGIDFYATGNEPFWALDIKLDYGLSFNTMSGFELNIPVIETIETMEDGSINFEGQTELGTIKVIVSKEKCADTMADEIFTHKVSVEAKYNTDEDFQKFEGCGRYISGSY